MPPTILLVDDRPRLQVATNRFLSEHFCGIDVLATDDREEAFRLAETQPQIAVVSYLFCKGNVISLAEGIQRQSGMTRILFVDMHESWAAVERVIRCGVRGLLLDSDPPELLVSAIEALSGGYAFFSPRIALLCAGAHSKMAGQPNISDLTARELEIFQHLSRGDTNKTMACQLNISVKTVEVHRAKLLKKLHLRSAVELVRWAIRKKLIQL